MEAMVAVQIDRTTEQMVDKGTSAHLTESFDNILHFTYEIGRSEIHSVISNVIGQVLLHVAQMDVIGKHISRNISNNLASEMLPTKFAETTFSHILHGTDRCAH